MNIVALRAIGLATSSNPTRIHQPAWVARRESTRRSFASRTPLGSPPARNARLAPPIDQNGPASLLRRRRWL